MVLAAGYGKRMMPLTATTPKPLLHVAGRSMLDHALDRLCEAGVKRAVVNISYLGVQITQHLSNRTDIEVIFSREETPLETGGGVKQALPHLGNDPFYVINADLPWLDDGPVPALKKLCQSWAPNIMDMLLLVMSKRQAHGFGEHGDFDLLPNQQLHRHHHPAPYSHVYIGVMIAKPELYRTMEQTAFSNNVLFDRTEAASRLYGVVHEGTCYHVGTPEDLARANELLASGAGWKKP